MGEKRAVKNITFHGLGVPPGALAGEGGVWVPIETFEAIVEMVKDRTDVRITFDDGNISDLAIGVPTLLKHGLKAEFFVVAGRIGAAGYLGRSEILELDRAGMGIGCHGMNHRSWRGLGASELRSEIVDSRRAIEDTVGKKVSHAACPMGEYGRRVLHQLSVNGYERVYTSDRGPARVDAWLQARTTIRNGMGMDCIAQIVNGEYPLGDCMLRSIKCHIKRLR